MSAADGAVVEVNRDDQTPGWKVDCSICGYVCGTDDPEDHASVQTEADHHLGWHDAEYAREQAYR